MLRDKAKLCKFLPKFTQDDAKMCKNKPPPLFFCKQTLVLRKGKTVKIDVSTYDWVDVGSSVVSWRLGELPSGYTASFCMTHKQPLAKWGWGAKPTPVSVCLGNMGCWWHAIHAILVRRCVGHDCSHYFGQTLKVVGDVGGVVICFLPPKASNLSKPQ